MTEAEMVEVMADGIADVDDTPAVMDRNRRFAQAALAALKAEGYMLCKWERDWYAETQCENTCAVIVAADNAGYKLTDLEQPAATPARGET